MREKTRDAIQKALFEAFFVVLAVGLALAANEWRQSRADRQQARSALASIVEELKSNRAAVQTSLEYHTERLQLLGRLSGSGGVPDGRDFPRGFVLPAQIFQTAWESAGETGALSHMEYSTVLELSRLYARQERYESQAQSVGPILYGELFRGGVAGVLENHANLAALIGTFSYREQQQLERYDEVLASLGETAPAAGP